MRSVLRVLAGLVLLTAGVLALAGGVLAWMIGQQRTASEGGAAFVATLEPVQTNGYAVVVPDVTGVLARHGVASRLGDGHLTITVRSATPAPDNQLVVVLVPAGDAQRYLAGTARTEVRSVGYTTGQQPVSVVDMTGSPPTGTPPWQSISLDTARAPAAGDTVSVSLDIPSQGTTALVVRRLDGAAGLTVSMTVAFAPSSLGTAMAVLFFSGVLGTAAGMAMLVLRRPWIDPVHPMVIGFEEGDTEPEPALVRRRHVWRSDPEPDGYWPINAAPAEDTVESPYVHTAT